MVEPTLDAAWDLIVEQRGVILAALALVGGWYLGRVLVRLFGRRISRRFQRPSVTRTALRLVRTGSLLLGGLAALTFLGIPVTSLALSVTVFSAMLGLVLAPIIGSVVNGLFVLADQPYEIGDLIEITDRNQRGYVEDITLRYTKVFTLENTFLVIPNSEIRTRDVVNYSAEDERVRLSLRFAVTYEGDLGTARRLVEEAAAAVDGVISGGPDIRIGSARYPAGPTCFIESYGDHGVQLDLRYWVREPYRLSGLRSDVHTEIWDRLQAAPDVEIAYPHSHLVFDETSGTAQVSLSDAGRPGPGGAPPDAAGRESGPRGTASTHRETDAGRSEEAAGGEDDTRTRDAVDDRPGSERD